MDLATKATATNLLGEDHRKVQALFQRFLVTEDIQERVDAAETIFKELDIHCRLEESLAFPGFFRAGAEQNLLQRFRQAHGDIKRQISEARLALPEPRGPSAEADARLIQIMAKLRGHGAEEEAQAFPLLAADPGFDQELGAELARLKLKLKVFPPIRRRIDLAVPTRVAYNQWIQFEAFPRIIDNVKEVRQLDDAHVRWLVNVGGKDVAWTAEIYEQIPDQRIAWITADSTRMLVEIAYEPQGLLEDLGALLGLLEQRLASALQRFKGELETRERETGGWRGKIERS